MPPNPPRSIDRPSRGLQPARPDPRPSESRAKSDPGTPGARAGATGDSRATGGLSASEFTEPLTCRGTVTLLYGCMFSGKTTELLRRLAGFPGGKALAFKHAIDTRYSASAIVSHGGKASPAIVVPDASAIERHVIEGAEMAAIDEAHFFDESLADVVARLAQRGVEVVLTSLQPDSWGRPFPVTERLLALADEPLITTGTCARCGASADRTQRLTHIIDGQMVVEPHHYEPRCRNCWRPPPQPR